jgi:hypothetical protein
VIGTIIRALHNLRQVTPQPSPDVMHQLDDYRTRLLQEKP